MIKVKELRMAKGISQSDLAKKLGISQSTVAMWENGTNIPASNKLPQLAKVLDCTIDELFKD